MSRLVLILGWFRGTPFRSPLQGSLKGLGARRERGTKVWRSKGASPSEGFKGASRKLEGGLKGASRGLEGDFKETSRGLQGGFERLEGSLKGASRGLEGGFKGASLSEDFKTAWRGLKVRLQGGLEGGLEAFRRWKRLWKGLKGLEEASKGLEGDLKGAAFSAEAGFEDACKEALYQRFAHM